MSFKRTLSHQKYVNKKRIMTCIRECSPVSRAEIAVKLQLSKPTVSLAVDELLQEKWVVEKGIGESSSQGGRRPIQLFFNEKAAYIIGTDIGGTKVKIVLCDLCGNILADTSFSTNTYLQAGILKQMAIETERLIAKNQVSKDRILGMGVGIPGITQTASGLVIEAPSLGWVQYPFIAEAKRYFNFPIYIDNDVNAAALGEQWLGNAQNKRNLLFIAVGTGIGSGIILNNQLYRGASSAAGEIGYMVTNKEDLKREFKPAFHRYGYLESVAGGKSIGDQFTRAVLKDPYHSLFERAQSSGLSGEDTFLFARKGDSAAIAIIDDAIENLAFGIVNASSLLNPEVIILGGGVLHSAEYILPRVREIVNRYLPSLVEMKTSQLGENAGVLGAVSLFLREHESILNFHDEGDY
ncbi:ROK family transcriptional regulator [Peribacillus muralis]|uniref:ROK family transcriptional regulator n=1 Tax=Peribacillus muralis TaxID=264697 RepID=UPI001F4DE07F|nr:ROK family transcriptional regulator [Peribacillus muralis]MCK1993997.1 ROK family transcriptional regulator [Peribacillus muralis]MCK2014552.1 ROK family transcriptional regulator [Peribacillus muralis]